MLVCSVPDVEATKIHRKSVAGRYSNTSRVRDRNHFSGSGNVRQKWRKIVGA